MSRVRPLEAPERLVEREQLVGSFLGKLDRDRVQRIFERQVLDVAASLEAQPVARVVAEDLTHGLGCDRAPDVGRRDKRAGERILGAAPPALKLGDDRGR